jgi:hypothetical protein
VLYHLLKSPDVARSIPEVVNALGGVEIPEGATVAVVDGMEMGVEPVLKADGTSVSTIWGEIAYQLSPHAYRKHVQSADDGGTAPGNEAFRKVLDAAAPCLIDELVSYLVKLKHTQARRLQNLYRQSVQFIQELLQEAGNRPGVVDRMSATYFDGRVAPHLSHDDSKELNVAELNRRIRAVTSAPILTAREEALRECIAEGVEKKLWAVAVGDERTSTYRRLIESKAQLADVDLFDGSAYLLKGELLALVREQMSPTGAGQPKAETEAGEEVRSGSQPRATPIPPQPPAPPRRHSRVRLRLSSIEVTKTSHLQPYLWKVIQGFDVTSRLSIVVDVECPAGLGEETLERQLVEGLGQLGIEVSWEAG